MSPRQVASPRREWTIPSRLDEVNGLVRQIRAFLAEQHDHVACFALELVVRESVNNAIIHGNRRNADLTVRVQVRVLGDGIELQVADEGPGFDWRRARRAGPPDDTATCGRGLPILALYASRVSFNRAGNVVTLRLGQALKEDRRTMAGYTISRTGTRSQVTLAGDLAAPLVPELQTALKQEFDQGAREVVFDFQRTNVLDSSGIGLLIATHNTLSRSSGAMQVVNLSPDVLHLLQSMRLVSRLNASGRV